LPAHFHTAPRLLDGFISGVAVGRRSRTTVGWHWRLASAPIEAIHEQQGTSFALPRQTKLAGTKSMRRMSELSVWSGVITGLKFCQSNASPLASLGEYLGRLRRLGWHPADMRAVEQHILELLNSPACKYQLETANAQIENA